MANSNVEKSYRRSERLWIPILLLLFGQFFSITPALLIVLADEQNRRASDEHLALLNGLDQLSVTLSELSFDRRSPGRDQTAWRHPYSEARAELDRLLAGTAEFPEVNSALARLPVDPADFREQDARSIGSELTKAEGSVRLKLAAERRSIGQWNTYLKVFVGGACLFAFGMVFLFRKFRIDAQVERAMQMELQRSNQEVIAALAATRSESEAKNRFLARIGDLMRTPLNTIADRTADLLETELTESQRDSVYASRELAQSLGRVASQVADYSAVESGGLALQPVEFEPAKVIADVVEPFSISAEHKRLKLKSEIAETLPARVKGDPERLEQVLGALLGHALHVSEHGQVVLRAEEVAGPEGRTTLRFEVRDTGSGLSEQARDRIFQPFVPSETSGSDSVSDTASAGLGLAISKKLVELMGGRIEVSSTGRGTTFSFNCVFESIRSAPEHKEEPDQTPLAASNPPASPSNGTTSVQEQNGKKPGRERRREQRHGINYPTILRSERAGIAIIRILDVSTSGLRVSVPFRLDLGSEVEVRVEGASVTGIVRNCTCIRSNEFHVGLQIPQASASDKNFLYHLRLLNTDRVS